MSHSVIRNYNSISRQSNILSLYSPLGAASIKYMLMKMKNNEVEFFLSRNIFIP